MKCCLVSEWVTNPFFFINEILNYGTAMIFQFSSSIPNKLPRILQFSVPFSKYSPFTSLGRMLRSSLYLKRPLFHTNSCKFLVHQTACFVGLYFRGGQNEYPWILPSLKTPNSLITFLSASSISGTMQNTLLQKSTEWKKRRFKEFYVKAKK